MNSSMQPVIELGRQTLEAALLVGAPLLVIAMVVSVLINILQVVTSIQDATVATVPRLFITAAAAVLLMPWMLRKLIAFTLHVLGDFSVYTR